MIVFDLKCKAGHVFEAWFPDSAAFKRQKAKRQVACPNCGNTQVTKAPMAPNIATGKGRGAEPTEQAPDAAVMLAKLREHIEKNCEYVGERFPEEARKIHYGETAKRDIFGEASEDDARSLHEEGIEFQRLPWARQNS
ncbi:MAG: DUF1178 family protein [Alphaproteobacteria bacterium]